MGDIYTQPCFELKENELWLSKLGKIKIELQRNID